MDGRGSAARLSERYPLLIAKSCFHTQFMINFGGKLLILNNFLRILAKLTHVWGKSAKGVPWVPPKGTLV